MSALDGTQCVVFGAGGMGGLRFCGSMFALEEMERRGVINLTSVRTFAGCSVGAMFALFHVLGLPASMVFDAAVNSSMLQALEPRLDMHHLCEAYGLDDGSRLKTMVLNILALGGVASPHTITLCQMFEQFGRELVCTVLNVTRQSAEYLSKDTRPHMPVWKAVVASMSIPIVFQPIIDDGDMLVDGAVVEPVPCGAAVRAMSRLVFYIDSDADMDTTEDTPKQHSHNVATFVKRLISCNTACLQRNAIETDAKTSSDNGMALAVPVTGSPVDALSFTMGRQQRIRCVLDGLISTQRALITAVVRDLMA